MAQRIVLTRLALPGVNSCRGRSFAYMTGKACAPMATSAVRPLLKILAKARMPDSVFYRAPLTHPFNLARLRAPAFISPAVSFTADM